MAVTIYDIAKRCNCSTTTVSKVFNNTGKISEAKKAEILQAARELGYVVNKTARSLASSNKASNLIGVMLHTAEDKSITHEMFSGILNAFRVEMEKNDYDICFLRNLEKEDDLDYENLISTREIDGVFIISIDVTDPKAEAMLHTSIPHVSFDLDSQFKVSSDNKESVAKLVDYAVNNGHNRIAFVCPHHYGVAEERFQGFLLGLERNNIPFDERMVIEAPYYSTDSAKLAVDKALSGGLNPTLIMFPDDYTAINAITYLRKLGLKVPNDISITGYDGVKLATAVRPDLTTMKQNTQQIGKEAASLLFKQIHK